MLVSRDAFPLSIWERCEWAITVCSLNLLSRARPDSIRVVSGVSLDAGAINRSLTAYLGQTKFWRDAVKKCGRFTWVGALSCLIGLLSLAPSAGQQRGGILRVY